MNTRKTKVGYKMKDYHDKIVN
uniref:Uncharacterized protein n=1 Tax=Rhizophora mucronata TaxID=61149 RepID=A0A2P2LP95_RHIMU